jgi:hypothetical protein
MTAWLNRHAAKLLVVSIALLICVPTYLVYNYTGKVGDLAQDNQELAEKVDSKVDSLQGAIVESCRINGNARAKVTRETIEEEIDEAEHPDPELIRALRLPPTKIDELIAKRVHRLDNRLDRVQLTNCASQYKIAPGSGDRRREKAGDETPSE